MLFQILSIPKYHLPGALFESTWTAWIMNRRDAVFVAVVDNEMVVPNFSDIVSLVIYTKSLLFLRLLQLVLF